MNINIVNHLRNAGSDGLTWKELSDITGAHHGVTSGSLSNAHRDYQIARLAQKRGGSRIYVLPEFVGDRTTEPHKQHITV